MYLTFVYLTCSVQSKKNVKLHPNTLSQFGVIFPKNATTTVCLAFCINPSSMPTQYTLHMHSHNRYTVRCTIIKKRQNYLFSIAIASLFGSYPAKNSVLWIQIRIWNFCLDPDPVPLFFCFFGPRSIFWRSRFSASGILQ